MAAVFFGADCEPIAENVLLALRDLEFPATGFRFGRSREKHDGVSLRQRFEKATHFVLIVDGDIAAVENFLLAGFSPDEKDDRDVPVISLAIQNRHTSILELLLAHDAGASAA